jgi:hypothetical protein
MWQTSKTRALSKNRQRHLAIALIAALSLASLLVMPLAAHAQSDGTWQSSDNPRFQAWRHASLGACSYKSAGTTCSFSVGNQSLTGTCETTAKGNLACRNIVSKQGLDSEDGSFDNGMSAGDISQ